MPAQRAAQSVVWAAARLPNPWPSTVRKNRPQRGRPWLPPGKLAPGRLAVYNYGVIVSTVVRKAGPTRIPVGMAVG
jgi:hypothetical protein